MSTKHSVFALALLTLIFTVPYAQAGQVHLTWNAPMTNADGTPFTDVAGYNVYYWQPSWDGPVSVNVGNQTTYTLASLADGQIYHFAVTAYDTSGNESVRSKEVILTMPLVPDTDRNGLTDNEEDEDEAPLNAAP